jgi:hypothetical protein
MGFLPVTTGVNYTITVGGGGSGVNGANSSITCATGKANTVAIGGGVGGKTSTCYSCATGGNGGSGGGAFFRYGMPGKGSGAAGSVYAPYGNPQGYNGGRGAYYNGGSAQGGGGGSTQQGADTNPNLLNPGDGGSGAATYLTGTLTSYASGGGGDGLYPFISWGGGYTQSGTAFAGGGGSSTGSSTANNGTVNTGGGGGSTNSGSYTSQGGSGIVVIRYPIQYAAPVSVTGTYSTPGVSGYRTFVFTGSGSITF